MLILALYVVNPKAKCSSYNNQLTEQLCEVTQMY